MSSSRHERGAETCSALIETGTPARKANALNIEVGQALPRCRCATPSEWGGRDARATRWLLSGGSALVLGICSPATCPIPYDEEP